MKMISGRIEFIAISWLIVAVVLPASAQQPAINSGVPAPALSPSTAQALPLGQSTPTSSPQRDQPTSAPAIRAPWAEPHPEIPYLPKPPVEPANWLIEHSPVTPNASPEAVALLHYLYGISCSHTMTGQHNFPAQQEYSTNLAASLTGKTPALYGTDWGFAADGDKDSAYVRHDTVNELIKQWKSGHIIALCWHEVPPTMDEPVTFRGQIQSHITDQEFDDLLNPGTPIYKHWCVQVDAIAEYLRELQDAHVPILWRPYHEINGDWFWWNGHRGDESHGSKQLYRQLYDRLVNFHHLTNLIWVWNPDQPSRADRQFVDYFPGTEYVDVLGLDCYGTFQQSFYDDLNALSGGKVMAISETSRPPSIQVYQSQPKWVYYMRWAVDVPRPGVPPRSGYSGSPPPPSTGAGHGVSGTELTAMVHDSRMFSLEDRAYRKAIRPIRKAAGLR